MSIQRGDVVLLDFPFSGGRGAKVRPAVVVQCDRNNQRLRNTIVVMITRTTTRADDEATQFLIDLTTPEGRQSGLASSSVVKCENLYTVEQGAIFRTIGHLDPTTIARLDACIRASLGLS